MAGGDVMESEGQSPIFEGRIRSGYLYRKLMSQKRFDDLAAWFLLQVEHLSGRQAH
jgi:hypothetical protein